MDSGGRKRGSERQLTKDDAFDDGNEGGGESGAGTFQRAEDSVLASRRIVKARRPPPIAGSGPAAAFGSPTAAPVAATAAAAARKPGLFAGFSLINQPPRSPAPAAVGDSDGGGGGEVPKDEADLDPRGRPVPPMPDPEVEEGPPKAAEADVTEAPESDDDDEITSQPKKPSGQGTEDGNDDGRGGKAAKEGGGAEEKGGNRGRDVGGEDEPEKNGSGKNSGGGEGNKRGAGLGFRAADGFAKLSSAPNAFASPFGVPISGSTTSSPFSFGLSVSSQGGPTPSVSPVFGGTAAAGSQGSFPSLSSVFGASNGAKVQLFGSTVADGGATGETSAGALTAPAVTLPTVDVVTGEEQERALFAADASLFEFVEEGKWKERGKGEVRLNAPQTESRPARLVMRAKGNLRLLLNANLFPAMKVTKMDGRGLTFAAVNSIEDKAENSGSLCTLALRFKERALADELLELIETLKGHKAGIGTSHAAKNTENGDPTKGGGIADTVDPVSGEGQKEATKSGAAAESEEDG